jgi:hypothetical protein
VKEIWEQAILAHNLPLTILLGFVIIFWLLAVLGTVDIDSLDVDFDMDTDIDGDFDTDVTPSNIGFLGGPMKFVNATDVPVMMVLSLLTLFMWVISILSNAAFNPGHSGLIAGGLIVGNLIVSGILVKIITQPLIPFFKAFKKGENDDEPVIGRIGTVKSRVIDSKYGQVEVPRNNGAPAIVNCRMADGHSPLVRGTQVLVFDKDNEKTLFIVREATPGAIADADGIAAEAAEEISTQSVTSTPTKN